MPIPDSAELLAARQRVQDAITDFARQLVLELPASDGVGLDPDLFPGTAGQPVLVAWVAGFEMTNLALEADGRAFRSAFGGLDQPLSASLGLGVVIQHRFE